MNVKDGSWHRSRRQLCFNLHNTDPELGLARYLLSRSYRFLKRLINSRQLLATVQQQVTGSPIHIGFRHSGTSVIINSSKEWTKKWRYAILKGAINIKLTKDINAQATNPIGEN